MSEQLVMFILQGILGLTMLFLGFILSGMRQTMQNASENMAVVAADLKLLNDAVLGKYVTRDDSDSVWTIHRTETESKWEAQRTLDHELRGLITKTMIDLAKISGKPYDYGGEQKDKT